MRLLRFLIPSLFALATSGLVEAARATDVSGNITTQTWTKADSPYRVTGAINVPAGNTLTIEPGVDVIVLPRAKIAVNGSIHAAGTDTDSIRFLPGSASSDWGGIETRMTNSNAGSASFAYTRISRGGCLYNVGKLTMANCVLQGCTISSGGFLASITLTNCTITGGNGGTLLYNSGGMSLTGCLIVGNTASYLIENYAPMQRSSSIGMHNCTLFGNNTGSQSLIKSSAFVSGGLGSGSANVWLRNVIIWGNSTAQPFTIERGGLSVTYSDIQLPSGIFEGTGNSNTDPLFLAAGTDSMRLHSNSPCRDTGDPSSPLDPDGSRADMGARPFDPTLAVESPVALPRFSLLQNAPNPFNPSTTIRFTLPEGSPVRLMVYDVTGRVVRTLADGTYQPGAHSVVWDGCDGNGRAVACGVYVYRLTTTAGVVTKRMTLLR